MNFRNLLWHGPFGLRARLCVLLKKGGVVSYTVLMPSRQMTVTPPLYPFFLSCGFLSGFPAENEWPAPFSSLLAVAMASTYRLVLESGVVALTPRPCLALSPIDGNDESGSGSDRVPVVSFEPLRNLTEAAALLAARQASFGAHAESLSISDVDTLVDVRQRACVYCLCVCVCVCVCVFSTYLAKV